MFNTYPSNASSNGAASTGTGTKDLLPPRLNRAPYGVASFSGQFNSNRYEGFIGNGDYVELPTAAGGNVEYFSSAGVSQWTVALTDINAACDDWVGLTFDSVADLIYIVAVDEGTTPNTYYTASVNSAGTVTNIGNDQPGTDFTTAAANWWHANSEIAGASMVQRENDGTGNLLVRQTNSGGMEEAEINILDGSFAADPAVVSSTFSDIAWKSQSGIYYSIDAGATQKFYSATSGVTSIGVTDPLNFGWTNNETHKFVQWKGRAVATAVASSASLANRISNSIAVFDAWIDEVADVYGME